jgi:hypothetical protein
MITFLVEKRNDYTTHLVNTIAPLVFEGVRAIYKEAQSVSTDNDVLKIFQSLLKRIPKWNTSMIENETNRILNSSQSFFWLNDLIKATIKAHIFILMYNPSMKENITVDPKFYKDIKTQDFIHLVYIECAREIWNNPYLMFHDYPPIDIKRNQRDCIILIKECIREALRKLLPVKYILDLYLGEEAIIDRKEDNFEKPLTEAEEGNLSKMIKKDLSEIESIKDVGVELEIKQTNTDDKTIGSKILNIINVPEKSDSGTQTDTLDNLLNETSSVSSDISKSIQDFQNNNKIGGRNKKMSEENNKNIKENSKKNSNNKTGSDKIDNKTGGDKIDNKIGGDKIDNKIKNILKKDLATDSDLETSLNYKQDNKYLEIFSNSNIEPVNDKSKKIFNNYLQF